MKLITAVIKPSSSMRCVRRSQPSRARDYRDRGQRLGRQKGIPSSTVARVCRRLSAQVKLEIAVSAEMADQAVEAIETAARTGKIGDGKIFVAPWSL